jgi:hypothetical protein
MQELKIATGSQKGFRSLLTCFDHLAQEQGLLNCFYFKGEFIRVESTLANSLSPVLDYVSSFVREGKADIQRIKADLVG